MTEPLVLNTIERLGRALFATLAPATGVRATGTITATAGPVNVEIPRNTYLLPVVGGSLREDLVYKTTEAFTLVAGTTEAGIPITSNVGGARHNLPAGTVFRFDPPCGGVSATATLDAAVLDASDDGQLIESVGFYEDLQSADPSQDLFAAKVADAGVLLVWTQSEPVEGGMAGLRQGATRATRAARFWRESFVMYVVASRLSGDTRRRQSGQIILQAVTRLLTDRHQNDDGETLSTIGAGVEITHRARLGRSERHYIYALQIRVNQTLEPVLAARAFTLWLHTHYVGALPGRLPPEPTEPLVIVDALDRRPGTLVLPHLGIAGGIRPLVTLSGELVLPRLELGAGGISPVVTLAGDLALPALGIEGGIRPLVSLSGDVALPTLGLAGGVTPIVSPIAGDLTLPSLTLAGEIRPLVAMAAASFTLPSLALAGAIRPLVSVGGAMTLPKIGVTGALTPAVAVGGSLILPSTRIFKPNDVSAISAWLRVANATSGVNGISSVPDMLNANPAVQSVDARKPVIELSANGLPCMRFATNDVLRWPITAQSAATNYAGWGFWFKPNAIADQYLIRTGPGTNGANGRALALIMIGNGCQPVASSTGGNSGVRTYVAPAAYTTAWQFATVEYDKDGASDAARLVTTVNCVQFLTGTVSGTQDISAGLFAATGNTLIGNANDGLASLPLNGLIGPNLYAFASKMAGAEFGLLTTAARTALMNFEKPT